MPKLGSAVAGAAKSAVNKAGDVGAVIVHGSGRSQDLATDMNNSSAQERSTRYDLETTIVGKERVSGSPAKLQRSVRSMSDKEVTEMRDRYIKQISLHQRTINDQETTLTHYLSLNSELQKELEVTRASVRELQLDISRQVKQDEETLEESRLVRNLESIRRAVEDFGRQYAAPTDLGLEEYQKIEMALSGFDIFQSHDNGGSFVRQFAGVSKSAHITRLCLTALLSAMMFRHCLSNPFFFVTDSLLAAMRKIGTKHNHGSASLMPYQSLMVLYTAFLAGKVDPTTAHEWRVHTLRRLVPSSHRGEAQANSLIQAVESACNDCGEAATKAFLQGPANLLMDPLKTGQQSFQRDRMLSDIFKSAGRLALDIWRQRIVIECLSLSALRRENAPETQKLMQAHPLHKFDDPSAIAQDARSVNLVVHPAIRVRDLYDDHEIDSTRVWAKAVVWLADGAVEDCQASEGNHVPGAIDQ